MMLGRPGAADSPTAIMKLSRSTAAIQSLCSLKLHAEVLVPAVLEALHAVIPSSRNLFDWTDPQGRLVRYFVEGPIDATLAQLYFDEFHNRREAEAMPRFDSLARHPRGVRSAHELDHAGFFRSALYNEIWRPQGFHTRLEGVVRGRCGTLVGSLVLYRAPGEVRFGLHEERQLAEVLPMLADGLLASGPACADDRHVQGIDPPESLLLTLQGQICHASAGAHRLLLMAEGGASRHGLSKPLEQLAGGLLKMVLARLRASADRATVNGSSFSLEPPPSIAHETPAGHFVATGVLLQPAQDGQSPLAHITLTRLEPHRVAVERALRALPLTPGQRAVCRELLQGRTHSEISQTLGVAPATVVDHVRKIYRSLDMRSTLELRAHVESLIGKPRCHPFASGYPPPPLGA